MRTAQYAESKAKLQSIQYSNLSGNIIFFFQNFHMTQDSDGSMTCASFARPSLPNTVASLARTIPSLARTVPSLARNVLKPSVLQQRGTRRQRQLVLTDGTDGRMDGRSVGPLFFCCSYL